VSDLSDVAANIVLRREENTLESNSASLTTFRDKCKRYVSPLKKVQIVSLCMIVLSLPFCFFFPILKLFVFLGVMGEVFSILRIKKLRCYKCNRNLSYLFLDPSYSKTGTSLILPNGLPDEIAECPHCHADFQKTNLP